MTHIDTLLKRIDAEFSALQGRIQKAQQDQVQEYQERQKRLTTFEHLLTEMSAIWKPRLEALKERFGDQVKISPRITSSSREAGMEFQSSLARIRLRLSASTDRDVRNLVLDYNLEIIPILTKFDSHDKAEWPIEAVDKEAVAKWLDDRIISFVKTYLSLHENEYYLKDHMVEDPIAGVRFPKFAATTKVDFGGKTYYFIGEETRCEFETKHGIKN